MSGHQANVCRTAVSGSARREPRGQLMDDRPVPKRAACGARVSPPARSGIGVVVALRQRLIRDLRRSRGARRLALGLGAAVAVLAGGSGTAAADSFVWSAPYRIDSGPMAMLACPSKTQCTALEMFGGEVTFDPTSATPSGQRQPIDFPYQDNQLAWVACPSVTQCTAVDGNGGEVTFDPTSATPNSTPDTIDSGQSLVMVACPSVTQCTAVGQNGSETTFDPTSASPNSTPSQIREQGQATGVSCPSTVECVAVDSGGGEVMFDPTTASPNMFNGTPHTI